MIHVLPRKFKHVEEMCVVFALNFIITMVTQKYHISEIYALSISIAVNFMVVWPITEKKNRYKYQGVNNH